MTSRQQLYPWKPGKPVAYRVIPGSAGKREDGEPPILLLTGFGVGNFHYDRLLGQLEGISNDVYLLDWFGQGDSWPSIDPCPSPEPSSEAGFEHGFGPGPVADEFEGFRFSADMWTEQVEHFLEEVVGRPAILCGNSLGGFIATNVSAQRPDLVEGLVLLNSTPFWGITSTGIWDGVYPLPRLYRSLGVAWWNWIRSPDTIRSMLDFVYAKPMSQGGYGEELVEAILGPTQQKAAASAFCSILSSPPPERSFDEMLGQVRDAEIPCMLAYGRDDPWIVPLWGHRAHRRLEAATSANDAMPGRCRYYEMTPVGHCPQDEAPEAVSLLLRSFVESLSREGSVGSMPKPHELNEQLSKANSDVEIALHSEPKPRSLVEALDSLAFGLQQRMSMTGA